MRRPIHRFISIAVAMLAATALGGFAASASAQTSLEVCGPHPGPIPTWAPTGTPAYNDAVNVWNACDIAVRNASKHKPQPKPTPKPKPKHHRKHRKHRKARVCSTPTCKARRAVFTAVRNAMYLDGITPGVTCHRTSGASFYCTWSGYSISDQATGNVGGTRGTADVTVYRGHYVARVYGA